MGTFSVTQGKASHRLGVSLSRFFAGSSRTEPGCPCLPHSAVPRSPPCAQAPEAPATTLSVSPRVHEPHCCDLPEGSWREAATRRPRHMPLGACYQLRRKRHERPAYQMLSLSATATHGVKGWNLTTEGTPGFLFRNIWSSSFEIPAQRETQPWAAAYRPGTPSRYQGRSRTSCLGTREARRDTQGSGRTRAWLPDPRADAGQVFSRSPSTTRRPHERARRAMGRQFLEEGDSAPAATVLVGLSGRGPSSPQTQGAEWGLTHRAPNTSTGKEAPRGFGGVCFRETIKRG